jgi:hypothetical protein
MIALACQESWETSGVSEQCGEPATHIAGWFDPYPVCERCAGSWEPSYVRALTRQERRLIAFRLRWSQEGTGWRCRPDHSATPT